MKSDIREALAEYVRACGGDPQTEMTETMERRIAREALVEAIGTIEESSKDAGKELLWRIECLLDEFTIKQGTL